MVFYGYVDELRVILVRYIEDVVIMDGRNGKNLYFRRVSLVR